MDPQLAAKREQLRDLIAAFDHVIVAFSGGVDSSYLLSVCLDVLGREHVLAVTVDSPLLPRAELSTARQITAQLDAPLRIIPFDELSNPEIASNPARRCYYCKRARFEALLALAQEIGGAALFDGENADDHLDYRPGTQAAHELGVRGPLAEAGLTKADIRRLSQARGLPNWDAPAAACLASRFPYDIWLTAEGLARVEQAEEWLHNTLGLRQLRVRDHHPIARLEVPAEWIPRLTEEALRAQIVTHLRALGYRYVTLDLAGYRMGSLNEELVSQQQ